jgi:hypothetical protein
LPLLLLAGACSRLMPPRVGPDRFSCDQSSIVMVLKARPKCVRNLLRQGERLNRLLRLL